MNYLLFSIKLVEFNLFILMKVYVKWNDIMLLLNGKEVSLIIELEEIKVIRLNDQCCGFIRKLESRVCMSRLVLMLRVWGFAVRWIHIGRECKRFSYRKRYLIYVGC